MAISSPNATERPKLLALTIGAAPDAWRRVGFHVAEGGFVAGEVAVRLEPGGRSGIIDWTLSRPVCGFPQGLPSEARPPANHPNLVAGVDHIVVATPDVAHTTAALEAAGCEVRGERKTELAGRSVTQRFLPLQNVLIELVAPDDPTVDEQAQGARLWGVTFVSQSLEAARSELGGAVSDPRPAVQPGRQIAIVAKEAGLGTRVAFMTPRVPSADI